MLVTYTVINRSRTTQLIANLRVAISNFVFREKISDPDAKILIFVPNQAPVRKDGDDLDDPLVGLLPHKAEVELKLRRGLIFALNKEQPENPETRRDANGHGRC